MPQPQAPVVAIVEASDGSLWASSAEAGLVRWDGASWLPVAHGTWRMAGVRFRQKQGEMAVADGTLWMSSGDELYRWDGTNSILVGHPPYHPDGWPDEDSGRVGDIAVPGDGGVWASGFYGWFPELGALARYDAASGAWEFARPWRAEDVPAQAMAVGLDGDLWVVLADWPEGWEALERSGDLVVEWVVARLDVATDTWTVFENVPAVSPPVQIAAGADAAWMLSPPSPSEYFDMAVWKFDGSAWTSYDEARGAHRLAVAPDGTAWRLEFGRVELLEE